MKFTPLSIAAAIGLAGLGLLAAPAVEARDHGRIVRGQGPHGGGYVAGRHVSREPGSATVTRGAVNRNGRGYRQVRESDWGDGTFASSTQRRYANGDSVQRSGTVTRGDGSISASRTRTGRQGKSQSGWSTIYRTDDGFTRSQGASTSQGRGYTATRDVSVSDSAVTIQTDAATNGGRAVSRTRTVPRPN